MATVRPMTSSDVSAMKRVCIETSFLKDKTNVVANDGVTAMYLDYYVENESQRCFVLDNNGEAVGYILSSDGKNFFEGIRRYLPTAKKFSKLHTFIFKRELKVQRRLVKSGFTAHLHIDILPEFQRQGYGKQLISALENKLKSENVKGLYLICSAQNTNALHFYAKCGFDVIKKLPGAVALGKKWE